MALTYVKLANVTADIAAGDLVRATVVASVTAGETRVVNLKGRMLTAAEFVSHLDGRIDGEDVAAVTGEWAP